MREIFATGVVFAVFVAALLMVSSSGPRGSGSSPALGFRLDPSILGVALPGARADQYGFAQDSATSLCTHYCVISNLSVGRGPTGLAFDSQTNQLYVANYHSNNVSVINVTSNKVSGSVDVGSSPWGAIFDKVNGEVYVTNNGQGTVSVISGLSVVANVSVGSGPQELTRISNGSVYISNTLSNDIEVLNESTNAAYAMISGGGLSLPVGEAYDPQSGNIYVANYGSGSAGTVTVVNGTSTTATIGGLGTNPQGAVYDPINGYVYVTNEYSGNVSVINASTNSIVGSVYTGGTPWGITCDEKTGTIFVAIENGSNQIAVISGLKISTTVDLAAGSSGTNGGALDDNVLYIPATGNLYATDYAAGRLYVISPTPAKYSVTVDRSGLPAGTEWWVNLTNGQSFHSSVSGISFKEINGTYQFKLASTNKRYESHAGSFSVAGAKVTKRVQFSLLTYIVTFRETGLPSGTEWWVNLTAGQSHGNNHTSITFREANGTYSYTIASADPTFTASGGTFALSGVKVNLRVRFT